MRSSIRLLSVLALAVIALLASCSGEDENSNDLTKQIVGTYTGKYISDFLGVIIDDEPIRVTKISDYVVRIDPGEDGFTESFEVKITQADDGLLFTIEEQNSIYIGEIRGYDGIPDNPDNHGSYSYATEFLAYGIWLTVNGVDYREVFTGYKD